MLPLRVQIMSPLQCLPGTTGALSKTSHFADEFSHQFSPSTPFSFPTGQGPTGDVRIEPRNAVDKVYLDGLWDSDTNLGKALPHQDNVVDKSIIHNSDKMINKTLWLFSERKDNLPCLKAVTPGGIMSPDGCWCTSPLCSCTNSSICSPASVQLPDTFQSWRVQERHSLPP